MSQRCSIGTSFWDRANDLHSRDFPSRISRFVRAAARRWCEAGMQLADDPRVLKAWRRHWDGAHFIKLHRWRQEGFQPKVVYDIGAHEGLWSEMCQDTLAPAKCFLFEPQLEYQRKAKARQPQGSADWEVVPIALGDRQEKSVLHVTSNAAASSLLAPVEHSSLSIPETKAISQSEVQVMPLDEWVRQNQRPFPDLVKIDVQGFEGRVIAGGESTLRQTQRLVVEVSLQSLYEGQSLLADVLGTLTRFGFRLEDVNETFRQWPGRLWQVDLWMIREPTGGRD